MPYDTIRLKTDARGVATLTLARPKVYNALSRPMMAEVHHALDRLGADPEVRVVVLTGEGEAFCSGGDIAMFREMQTETAEERLRMAFAGSTLGAKIAALSKPVIGRINGGAYGGGVGMVAACDINVGVEGIRFAFTELKRGLAPGAAVPVVLHRLGAAAYKRLLFTGRPFDAAEARRIGLLDEVVPRDALDDAVAREVNDVLTAAPGALATMKRAVEAILRHGPDAVQVDAIRAFADGWVSDEGREGVASFLEKRRPAWDVADR